ncbi:uncharacterized protein NECHADRAFT_76923 [Fusarium vanettenii 77-13-4]|uniref:Transcription factor domain-containing protein n=1 Tax=Fusarium vanettenii (strain ATCC MYA-4622 / CBS 123669 / FGSC 9596 / NRRL 45880 / 77-13-4) TaxID=660122 RepID=C7Z5N0_FUSV7|nr:uncharacterized protein NECHADRAFT_76923 [Fusarium vanettenii 77-13-4]EEU41125.1 hypothetical protein NECHADRAFT_76923 [Fusarium vanettenii 77-13-4]
MDPDQQKLVFVNKDSSSTFLTRSQGGERAFILSHVQRRRRQGAASKQPWSQRTSQFAFDQETNTTSSDDKGPQLLTSSPSNNGFDPFHCTIAAMDAGNHAMLHFTFDQGAKLTFLAEAFAPSALVGRDTRMRHERAINERLKHCVEDEALMYSTLAYGSCCQGWMAGILDRKRPPEYFIDKALQAVRERLQDTQQLKIDNQLALSIYSLAITEFWSGSPNLWTRCPERHKAMMSAPSTDTSAARTHLGALSRVVGSAGGWSKFDPYVLESTILADKFLALAEFKPPVVPLTWDPISLFPGYVEGTRLTLLRHNLLSKVVSLDLYLVLQDVTNYFHYAASYWSGGERHANVETNLFLKLQALTYRLLHLQDLEQSDNCIRTTTLTILLSATQYHGSQASARTLISRLRQALVEARFCSDGLDEGIRFWCLYTAAMTTEASPDKDWFLCMIHRFYLPSALDYQVEERLRGYLFLPDRQGAQLSALMDELASLR